MLKPMRRMLEIVVTGGEIVEMAPHDDLMAEKGFSYAPYMSQFKGAAPGGMEPETVDFASTLRYRQRTLSR